MTVVSMSDQEFSRLQVLLDVQSGRLRIEDAAQLLGLRRRQVFRLLKGVREDGPAGLISKRRGRPSNRRLPSEYRELAMALVRERYADFGPTLATEKLTELHGFGISRETLRHWMIEDGLWIDRRRRLPSVHQPRNRRECLGELVQIDGSDHAWFEDRRSRCTLIAFIDDATSRLMALRFVKDESTFDYFRVTRTYLEDWGKPVAFYSDKFSVFRVYQRDAEGGTGMTQFGRALHELNIDIICANSPQAKGRVERAFGTLQDRLVKELRLARIDTIEAANGWLPTFMADHNRRFAKPPKNVKDLHRRLLAKDNLTEILATRHERSVSANLTVHYDRMVLILEPNANSRPLSGKRVTIVNYPDGRFAIQYRGSNLAYRVFDKIQTVQSADIVENKRLGAVLALIQAQQNAYPANKRRRDPARYRHINNLDIPTAPAT
jgi:Winged helix-turn helix